MDDRTFLAKSCYTICLDRSKGGKYAADPRSTPRQSHEGTSLQSHQSEDMSTVAIVCAGFESLGLGAHFGGRAGAQQIDHDPTAIRMGLVLTKKGVYRVLRSAPRTPGMNQKTEMEHSEIRSLTG
jgi:hypothetical protein